MTDLPLERQDHQWPRILFRPRNTTARRVAPPHGSRRHRNRQVRHPAKSQRMDGNRNQPPEQALPRSKRRKGPSRYDHLLRGRSISASHPNPRTAQNGNRNETSRRPSEPAESASSWNGHVVPQRNLWPLTHWYVEETLGDFRRPVMPSVLESAPTPSLLYADVDHQGVRSGRTLEVAAVAGLAEFITRPKDVKMFTVLRM